MTLCATVGLYLGLSVLAAYGMALVQDALESKRLARPAALAIIMVTALELWGPLPVSLLAPIPAGEYWLATQPRIHVIAELPIDNRTPLDWQRQTAIMEDSTVHWKQLVNGSASVDPVGTAARRAMVDAYPAAWSVAGLRALHVDAVVLRLAWLPPARLAVLRAHCHALYADAVEMICATSPAVLGPAGPKAAGTG